MPCPPQLTLTKNLSNLSKYKSLFESPKLGVFTDVIQKANNLLEKKKKAPLETFTFSQ